MIVLLVQKTTILVQCFITFIPFHSIMLPSCTSIRTPTKGLKKEELELQWNSHFHDISLYNFVSLIKTFGFTHRTNLVF
ncbi:hypothetical protein LX77_00961 [Gelidibacter algens]|uniref:Uncharacterized protein n=1 Tax=Gelidibacter algens TaxID=49280 RepID=A0A327SCC0_9FLAO|nr:hypothetical protein LX77_00961 [Gelidibacter algens]